MIKAVVDPLLFLLRCAFDFQILVNQLLPCSSLGSQRRIALQLYELLTLSAHAREGYSSHFVSVCHSVSHF